MDPERLEYGYSVTFEQSLVVRKQRLEDSDRSRNSKSPKSSESYATEAVFNILSPN